MGINSVIISGRPAQDPAMKTSRKDGSVFCTFTLCHTTYRGATIPKNVEYFDCICFDKTAQNVLRKLKKGMLCTVQGRLSDNKWTASDGTKQRNTVIAANIVEICEKITNKPSYDLPEFSDDDPDTPREIQDSLERVMLKDDPDMPI